MTQWAEMTTTETDRQAEASVRAIEERVFGAIKSGNVAALREELTEDFVHSPIGNTGFSLRGLVKDAYVASLTY